MKETTTSEVFRTASECLQSSAASAASEAERQIRENAPRLIRSARRGYDEASNYVGGLVENHSLPALLQ